MSTEKPLTIRDIAVLAGVSGGTVSRVMNDKPGVGDKTRKRILTLIEEYGFQGDSTARQLSTGRSQSIGIVFPLHAADVVMHPVYPELLGAISDAAQDAGYDVNLFTTTAAGGDERVIRAVARKRIDGLILPAASGEDTLLRRAVELSIPTVLVGHRHAAPRMRWVDCSHDEALYDLTSSLLESGRRSLVLANGSTRFSAYHLRAEGFLRAVHDAGLDDVQTWEFESGMSFSDGLRLGEEILGLDGVDAVLACADTTAAGILTALERAGIGVPERIAVTGFDDTDFAATTTPPLTTVRMPLHETGEAAVASLLDLLGHTRDRDEHDGTVFPTSIIERESSGTSRPIGS